MIESVAATFFGPSALLSGLFLLAAHPTQETPPTPPAAQPDDTKPADAKPAGVKANETAAAASESGVPGQDPVADAPYVQKEWPAITFKEIAKSAGIDCVNLSGAPDKPRLIDTLGCGLCWFDYDGDGWLDLFVPNGATLDDVIKQFKEADAKKAGAAGGDPKPPPAKNPPAEPKKGGPFVEQDAPADAKAAVAPVAPPKANTSDRLFRNQGDGTFADVTEKAGLHDDRWGIGCAAGDFDNDGDEDLFVCNFGYCFLYRNNGDGTFTDIAEQAGVQFGQVTPGAGWGDIDGDGDLDLYVSAYLRFGKKNPWPAFAKMMRNMRVMNGPQGLQGEADKLFRNDGDGKFVDITKDAGLRTAEIEFGFTIAMVDLNGDEKLDLFVCNDMTPNHHYRQLRPGKFMPCASESGLATDENGVNKACMGLAMADLNDDLIPDFFITDFSAQTNDMYWSQGGNQWVDDARAIEKARTALPYVGWGTGFYDFDLDGDEDLVAFNGHVFPQVDTERPRVQDYAQLPLLFRRDGRNRWTDVGKLAGTDFNDKRNCRGAAFADYDDDGDTDIALFQIDKPLLLLRNDTAQKGHFLKVELLGTTINRDAYGSRIVVEAGDRRFTRWILGQGSFISQNDPRANFGLGPNEKVDRITVRWTGGEEEVVEGPIAVDQTIVIKQRMGKVAELATKPQLMTRAAANALQAKFLVEHPDALKPAEPPAEGGK